MADREEMDNQLEGARRAVRRAYPRSRGDGRAATTHGQHEMTMAIVAVAEAVLALAEVAAQSMREEDKGV